MMFYIELAICNTDGLAIEERTIRLPFAPFIGLRIDIARDSEKEEVVEVF